jgi:hypothetical protein
MTMRAPATIPYSWFRACCQQERGRVSGNLSYEIGS